MASATNALTTLIGGKSASADAEFTSIDLNPTSTDIKAIANEPAKKKLTRVQRKENANKKLENKIEDDKKLIELKQAKLNFELTITKAKIESFTKSEKEERLLEELKQQQEKLEIKKIKNKFENADLKFIAKHINNEITYEVPMYSCVIKNESDKPILKVLLDERSKKAKWLGLSKNDMEREDWMSCINPALKTVTQLLKKNEKNENDEEARLLFSLLENYSSMKIITPAPPAPPETAPAKQE